MIPPKIDYIYIITYFQKSIIYQPLFKTEPNIKKGIPFDHLAILCRQFYFTLSAGVPMLRAIGMIKDQIEVKKNIG